MQGEIKNPRGGIPWVSATQSEVSLHFSKSTVLSHFFYSWNVDYYLVGWDPLAWLVDFHSVDMIQPAVLIVGKSSVELIQIEVPARLVECDAA